MLLLNTPRPSLKTLAATIAITSAFASFPAHSLQITASNTWTVSGGSTQSDIDGPASSGSVDVLDGDNDGAGNSIFYHTFGNANGRFGSRSSGEGTFDISGLYSFSENYTATGGDASFSFNIIPGEISLAGGTLLGSDSLFAGYSLEIFLNGGSIWDSSATIEKSSTETVFSDSGTSLLGSLSDDSYSFGSSSHTLDLGSFSSGDAINISYSLTTHARGNISSSECTFDGGGDFGDDFDDFDGDGPRRAPLDDSERGIACSSIARIGDPNNFGQTPNTSFISGATPGTAVPEPASIALLGLGLIGFGFSRKKH